MPKIHEERLPDDLMDNIIDYIVSVPKEHFRSDIFWGGINYLTHCVLGHDLDTTAIARVKEWFVDTYSIGKIAILSLDEAEHTGNPLLHADYFENGRCVMGISPNRDFPVGTIVAWGDIDWEQFRGDKEVPGEWFYPASYRLFEPDGKLTFRDEAPVVIRDNLQFIQAANGQVIEIEGEDLHFSPPLPSQTRRFLIAGDISLQPIVANS